MSSIQEIETERLLLRKATMEDLDTVYNNIWKDENIAKWMLWQVIPTREAAAERLQRICDYQKDAPAFFVALKETNEVIGWGGFFEKENGIYEDSGLCITAAHQGKGYAREMVKALISLAFNHYHAKEFIYGCFQNNTKSAAVCKALGFTYSFSKEEIRQWDSYHYTADYYRLTSDTYQKLKEEDMDNASRAFTDTLTLILPTVDYADEIWQLRREIFISEDTDKFAGCGSLATCRSAREWIKKVKKAGDENTIKKNKVPADFYLAVRQSDNKVVGILNLRHHIDHPILRTYGGHIGYSIRPSERQKGYAKKMLALGLEKAKALRINKVLITCRPDNIASEKTILANGGVYENTYSDEDGLTLKRYWISL